MPRYTIVHGLTSYQTDALPASLPPGAIAFEHKTPIAAQPQIRTPSRSRAT
jgi:hypothetical protein